MSSRIIVILTVVLVLAFSSSAFCLEAGDKLIDVEFTTLDGKKIKAMDFIEEDQYTIFDIWATW